MTTLHKQDRKQPRPGHKRARTKRMKILQRRLTIVNSPLAVSYRALDDGPVYQPSIVSSGPPPVRKRAIINIEKMKNY